ncbi:MAG: AAA family ATPase [Planctomycetaceae bacterium]|nr:AAA family ATPase [Planctomycetaceae bacterium]
MSLKQETLDEIQDRLNAHESLLVLQTDDEPRWVEAITNLSEQTDFKLVTWSLSTGLVPADVAAMIEGTNHPLSTPVQFLDAMTQLSGKYLFLAKDIEHFMNEPEIVRRLLDQAQSFDANPLLLIGSDFKLPGNLSKVCSLIHLPMPDFEELATCLRNTITALPEPLEISDTFLERMVKGVIGLTRHQAQRAFSRVLAGRTELGEETMTQLVSEKRQLLQGSDLLEFHELDESADDIGGLEGLKDWIQRRVKAFSPDAQKKKVGQPKGVLLLGVQGCGKSLSARVIARQLSFPLVRLDFGNLLQSGRGTSESNLREVLRMMDSMAPAVLWIEEIEKGFSGLQGSDENQDSAMTRMFGQFLTWMQEHTAPIFVVATANSIESLPPELLRRGRFDEIFFIDLPNFHERKHIYQIHLAKRGCDPSLFNLDELSDKVEGYSGAEIEQIVNSAVIDAYTYDRLPNQKNMLDTSDTIVPLSITMEDKVFELREWARSRCRPATPDSRVMRMLEDEHRKGELGSEDPDFPDPWLAPLKVGDIAGAVQEYIRATDHVTFFKIQQNLERHISTQGNANIVLKSDTSVILWQDLDVNLAQAIAKYINNKRIFLNPVDASHYQKLGKVLKIPVLSALRDKPLPRDVWFPCVLRIMPPREGSGRLREVIVIEEP